MKNIILLVDDFQQINNFYPKGLPKDWQLDFFLNEFDAVKISKNNKISEQELMEAFEDRDKSIDFSLFIDKLLLKDEFWSENKNIRCLPLDHKETIELNLNDFVDLKALRYFLQPYLYNNKNLTVVINTPCDYIKIKECQTLIDLLV